MNINLLLQVRLTADAKYNTQFVCYHAIYNKDGQRSQT